MDDGHVEFLNPAKIQQHLGIQRGAKVADFGCGSGEFSIAASELAGEEGVVYAIDVRDDPLTALKGKIATEGLHNIEVVRGNLEVEGGSSLHDMSQDVVLVINTLFQSKKHEEIFKEARRVLKPGGRLVVVDWRKATSGFGPPEEHRTDPTKVKTVAVGSGFTLVEAFDAGTFHYGLVFTKNE